jgi:hypothetical protein
MICDVTRAKQLLNKVNYPKKLGAWLLHRGVLQCM